MMLVSTMVAASTFDTSGRVLAHFGEDSLHSFQRGIGHVWNRVLQVGVRAVERGEITLGVFFQNRNGLRFVVFKIMNRFHGGPAEARHGVALFTQHLLAGDDAAVSVGDPFAGEIGEDFEPQLFRLFLFGVAENRELRLTLLHHDHAQVGRADHAQIDVAVGIEADMPQAQAHGEVGGSSGRVISADFALEIFDTFHGRSGDEIVRQKTSKPMIIETSAARTLALATAGPVSEMTWRSPANSDINAFGVPSM